MKQQNLLHRIWEMIRDILSEIQMNIDMTFRKGSPQVRLKWLRFIYYTDPKATIKYRRVREIMQEYVDKTFYDHYERLLSGERSAYQILNTLPSNVRGGDLLEQMQHLGEKIIDLIEQAQIIHKSLAIYPEGSPQFQTVNDSYQALMQRVETALNLHASIPAKLLSFSINTAGRGMDKLGERIAHLSNQLDDIAETYNELDQRKTLEMEIEETLRNLENNTL